MAPTSSARPSRRSGMLRFRPSTNCSAPGVLSSTLRKRGVSIEPGAITFARTRRPVLDRDLLGEQDEPGLGGAVRGVALGADEPEHRRGVDDAAALAREHVGERGAARAEDRREVRGDREVPVVVGAVDQAARHLHRGVVVEDVDAPVAVHGRGDHRVDVGPLRDVGVHGHALAVVLLEHADGLGRAVVVDVDDDDARTLLGHELRGGAALTRTRPGDQRDLAREQPGEVEVEVDAGHGRPVTTRSRRPGRPSRTSPAAAACCRSRSRRTPWGRRRPRR